MPDRPVTSLSHDLHPAEELGLDPAALTEIETRAQRMVDDGPWPGLQVAVARYGRLALFRGFGTVTETSRFETFSATKPVTNSAIWVLWGEGRLSPDTVAAEVVPEFGTNDKDQITVEQLMCQTAGFPHAPLDFFTAQERANRLERFAKWRLNWAPGTASEYHPTAAHWVLAEVIERTAGCDYRDFVQQRIVEPLGLPTLRLGVPLDEQGDIEDLVVVGAGAGGYGETEANVTNMLNFNHPSVRSLGIPSAGCYSTTADFALLYQAFLHDPYRIWDPEVLADVKTNVRNRLVDRMSGRPANLSFGLNVNLDAGPDGAFGSTVSPSAFGWTGAGGQEAWADPRTGISFACFTHGLDQDFPAAHKRSRELGSIAGRAA